MPLRLGALAYPVFVLAMAFARPGAVVAFEKANACSPDTSRRPTTLNVKPADMEAAVRRRHLVAMGDGRFYLDRAAVRRDKRRLVGLLVFAGLAIMPLAWLLL